MSAYPLKPLGVGKDHRPRRARDPWPLHDVEMSISTSKSSVAGNARLTGTFGAAIFVLLFAEGVTILRVGDHISAHVFIGVLLIPFVAVKIASTGYRFFRYYTGRSDYVAKGPPPMFLRLLGPVVTVTTVAVLATGVAAVLDLTSHWLVDAHRASFIIWFAAMTLHVLGHVLETPALALADLRRTGRAEANGAGARLAALALVALTGVVLATASLGWAHHWQHERGHKSGSDRFGLEISGGLRPARG